MTVRIKTNLLWNDNNRTLEHIALNNVSKNTKMQKRIWIHLCISGVFNLVCPIYPLLNRKRFNLPPTFSVTPSKKGLLAGDPHFSASFEAISKKVAGAKMRIKVTLTSIPWHLVTRVLF